MRKTILGVAGIAVALTLIGGATFAAWDDFQLNTGNVSGADHLTLNVDDSSTALFDNVSLAPGVLVEREFVVASREGNTVPDASLRLAIEDLFGIEDGCTSNSEEEPVSDGGDGGTCATEVGLPDGLHGQFIDEARINITSTNVPTTNLATACDSGINPRGGRLNSTSLRDFFENKSPVNLLFGSETLQAGEGVCVGIVIQMPETATNASQGDSSTFNLRFLLDQIV